MPKMRPATILGTAFPRPLLLLFGIQIGIIELIPFFHDGGIVSDEGILEGKA